MTCSLRSNEISPSVGRGLFGDIILSSGDGQSCQTTRANWNPGPKLLTIRSKPARRAG
jgi:hypothetical protein